jgi:hypothetical protein
MVEVAASAALETIVTVISRVALRAPTSITGYTLAA